MTFVLKLPTEQDFHAFVAEQVRPTLVRALEQAGSGQRLRVNSLPEKVIAGVCRSLQGDQRWCARVLTDKAPKESWQASATKIIELRNTLREPLIVFIPQGLRNAAEDSLDIATFTELSTAPVVGQLVEVLLAQFESSLQDQVREVLSRLRLDKVIHHADDEVSYLLIAAKNGATAEAAGGALFALGLIPDFELFRRGAPLQWVSRNQVATGFLGDTSQPLQARIGRLKIKPNTIQADLFRYLRHRHSDEVRVWASAIACDEVLRNLAFEHWPFSDALNEEELRLILEPLTLPLQSEDLVAGAARLPVLNLARREPLKIAFKSVPKPNQYATWKHFRFQLLSLSDAAPSVAWESNNYPKTQGPNARISRSVRIADLQSLEEGTYFLKVEAFDADGALINASPRLADAADAESRAENESERFIVLREEAVAPPEDARTILVPSLTSAWMRVAARRIAERAREGLPDRKDLNGTWDAPAGAAPRADVHFAFENEGFTGLAVAVPSLLRKVELSILQEPTRIGRIQMGLAGARSATDVELKFEPTVALDEPSAATFVAARENLLGAILRDHVADGAAGDELSRRAGIVETVDLSKHQAAILKYLETFIELAEKLLGDPTKHAQVRALAALDVVELRWRASAGDPGRALLIAPVHPLRIAWHMQHSKLCEDSISAWVEGTGAVPSWKAFVDQLQSELSPVNLPMALFDRRGRGYVEQTPITPFWPLYLPDRAGEAQMDAAAARDRILSAMGINDRAVVVSPVSAAEIASRLFEYLQQHPYVEQLRLNVFNPGDGRFIADVLRALERRRSVIDARVAPSLRYAVHLFGTSEHLDLSGDGLEALLDPERQVSEDDEFTLGSSNHLLPKLIFSRNTTEEFLQTPERYGAHVSILNEQFIAQARIGKSGQFRRGSFVKGLILEPEVQLEMTGPNFGWTKGLRAAPAPGSTGLEVGIARGVDLVQRLHACAALGGTLTADVAPVVALLLDANGQSLLRRVHDHSDWVVTIDRNLGLDYFDRPSASDEVGYLLDFAPEYLHSDRQRVLLTTRSTMELESLIRPALERLGLVLGQNDEVVVLEALRSLSGRFALRFESGGTQAAEVIGLLLARWLLESVDLMNQRIVIPLDAHRGWFAKSEDEADGSEKRADLLLVGFERGQKLRFDIVEVKLRDEIPGAARLSLYQGMHEQVRNTERRLRELFDPEFFDVARADFLLRAKELAAALGFYVKRAVRYGLMTAQDGDAAIGVIENLDAGYRLDIRTIGVVFERQGRGVHEDEEEPGFRVYRFGGDIAQRLFAYAVGRHEERRSSTSSSSEQRGGGGASVSSGNALLPSGPDLDSFRAALSHRTSRLEDHPVHEDAVGGDRQVSGSLDTHEPASASDMQPQLEAESLDGSGGAGEQLSPLPSVLLGSTELTPQYGTLGRVGDQVVAVDLNGCNTISLFGVQGFGKSYTLGVIAEMATTPVERINVLPFPLATVIFHYHKSDAYEPEHATAIQPNGKRAEIDRLLAEYGARPKGLEDVVMLTPEAKVAQRRTEYPSLQIEPIKFSSAELGAESWKYLLGAYGNDALYIRQLVAIMRRHRSELTLATFRQEIETAELPKATRQLAEDRLRLAEPYIDDSVTLGSMLRPGRTVIIDLRDEWIEKDEALGLFVVMMRIFAAQKYDARDFNKLVVFDEAHKYMSESALISQVVETIREMRHQATSVLIASQDPLSVPRAVIELSSMLVLHRITSPQWMKHLKGAIGALGDVAETQVAALKPGEALVWAQRSTDSRFSLRPQKVTIRPRFTQHGGGTRTAVMGATVR